MLKSERVLISEGIEATPTYVAIYARTCTCVCTYSIQCMYSSHVATRMKKNMTSSSSGVSGAALCVYDSVIRGHHVYKTIWTPYIGETLLAQKDPTNSHDRRAVAIVTPERAVVGHVPREIAKLFWYFLGHGGNITCEVTGHRRRSNGLEVPLERVLICE